MGGRVGKWSLLFEGMVTVQSVVSSIREGWKGIDHTKCRLKVGCIEHDMVMYSEDNCRNMHINTVLLVILL